MLNKIYRYVSHYKHIYFMLIMCYNCFVVINICLKREEKIRMTKYKFLPAAQTYLELKDEFEAFSALKKSAFVVFDKGFDVNQLESRLKSWHAICEWNSNDDVKRSCMMVPLNFSIVLSIFEDLEHGRISRKQFHNDLACTYDLINNHEARLLASKDAAYEKLISLYNTRAEAEEKLGFIYKEPQVQDWVIRLLQS